MKLSDRLDQALYRHNLAVRQPIEPEPEPEPEAPVAETSPEPTADYETIEEGLTTDHDLDEDGIGCFTANKVGLDKIQLPTVIGDWIVEDIQRMKTGIYQVHIRKAN